MLFQTFLDFFFQYYHKAHKNIAYSIENSLPQLAAKFFPQKGANLKSKKAHCALHSLFYPVTKMPSIGHAMSNYIRL